jgi:hypothetical protein
MASNKLILADLEATLFPPTWRIQMTALYGEGGCDVEARGLIASWRGGSFNQDTWERWLKDEPGFAELIEYCRQICHSWWLKKGRTNLGNVNFNARLYALQMNNRFGWSDARHDVSDNLTKLLEVINGQSRDLPVKASAGAAEPDAGQS